MVVGQGRSRGKREKKVLLSGHTRRVSGLETITSERERGEVRGGEFQLGKKVAIATRKQ